MSKMCIELAKAHEVLKDLEFTFDGKVADEVFVKLDDCEYCMYTGFYKNKGPHDLRIHSAKITYKGRLIDRRDVFSNYISGTSCFMCHSCKGDPYEYFEHQLRTGNVRYS